ncbi:MAG: hypothetical protein JST04_12780 [Bdellovibrionales bacterium]|nr:hypothetical protein [Bdellovibrionales bacterium]
MRRLKVYALSALMLVSSAVVPVREARADLFGGDVAVLMQILAQMIQEYIQIKNIVSNGADTLDLLREINSGIRDGLSVIQILNPKFNPGLYGDLRTADAVLATITDLYGKIPQSSESRLQQAQDQSVAESIAMNGSLFQYADQADEESRRIFSHSQVVSPQGAAKLTAQSLSILIGVSTQVLRTNSMMLKMMGENMALNNRREKLQSQQFREQYNGLGEALDKLPSGTSLPALKKE